MSNYSGRHGPNVSQYLRDLNTISPQEGSVDENFNIEGDLALFTNTEFFDFETGQNTDFQAQPVKEKAQSRATPASDDVSAATSVMGDMPNLDFMSSMYFFFLFANLLAFVFPLSSLCKNGICPIWTIVAFEPSAAVQRVPDAPA